MYWIVVDERLIKRGELLLGLEFLEVYDAELTALNIGKVGRPFKPLGMLNSSRCTLSFLNAL